MAFPTVAGTTSSFESTAVTSHTVNLPGSIGSGELLIAVFGKGQPSPGATITFPGGWTPMSNTSSGGVGARWAYAIATGSEGASISVGSSSVCLSAHRSWRIQGHNTTTNALQDQGFWNVGTSTSPDPPGLTPTGGTKDYLWLEFAAALSGLLCTSASTSFTNLETIGSGVVAATDVGLSTARRELNGSTTDPSAMTLPSSDAWLAITTAVHPGSEGIPIGASPRYEPIPMIRSAKGRVF